MKYTLKHQMGDVRCAWCWKCTSANEQHAVIEANGTPWLQLRFHIRCWDIYRNVSGCDPEAFAREWTPQRIELLRLCAGLSLQEMAREIRISYGRLLNLMDDAEPVNYLISQKLKTIAIRCKFENSSRIDWSNPEAIFCLRMSQRWTESELSKQVGCKLLRITSWQRSGIPVKSNKAWARLNAVADRVGFDNGDVVSHRMWTKEYLQKSIADSGKPDSRWQRIIGCSAATFFGWKTGRRAISRAAAWKLTRAATSLGLPLPPRGVWKEKLRKSRADMAEQLRIARATNGRLWTIEKLRLLGTMPDTELVSLVGKSRMAIRIMRALMGIPGIDPRWWDGRARTQVFSDDELINRQQKAREKHASEVSHARNDFDGRAKPPSGR